MCVNTANCSGTCSECMSDKVRRLTMANKQLTKMCDQYLAELAAERQRSRMPEELVERAQEFIEMYENKNDNPGWRGRDPGAYLFAKNLLAWHDGEEGK